MEQHHNLDAPVIVVTSGDPGEITPAEEDQTEATKVFDELYAGVKKSINMKTASGEDIINILTLTMEAVEKMKIKSGPQKKALVLHVIDKLVDEIPESNKNKSTIKTAVKLLAPGMIDTIVATSRGQVFVNIKQGCKEKFPCCVVS